MDFKTIILFYILFYTFWINRWICFTSSTQSCDTILYKTFYKYRYIRSEISALPLSGCLLLLDTYVKVEG